MQFSIMRFMNRFSNPNMAYAAGAIPAELAKHRGHPLKSFSIPAPPSNTPLIPGQKPGKN